MHEVLPRSCHTVVRSDRREILRLSTYFIDRSQRPRGLRCRSVVDRMTGSRVLNSCECCVLSGRILCGELFTRPEESYWVWCVSLSVIGKPQYWGPGPLGGCCAMENPVFYWLVLWILEDTSLHTQFRWSCIAETQGIVAMGINIGQLCRHSPDRSTRISRTFISTKNRFSYFATFGHKSDNIEIGEQKQYTHRIGRVK